MPHGHQPHPLVRNPLVSALLLLGLVIVLGVLVLAVGLSLGFRDWRDRYRARAAFGAREEW